MTRQDYEPDPIMAGPPYQTQTAGQSSNGLEHAANIENASRPSTIATLAQPEMREEKMADRHAQKAAMGPGPANIMRSLASSHRSRSNNSDHTAHDVPAPGAPLHSTKAGETAAAEQAQPRVSVSASMRSYLHFPAPLPAAASMSTRAQARELSEKPKVERQPPLSAPLHPYFRWCSKCEHVKPPRTHHCRHCGTCILNMDHHCPW